jgi:hypothetical protein
MSGLDGDERTATGGSDFAVRDQFSLYYGPIG